MKVKIGEEIFDSEKEPIMLILSDEDKNLISRMDPKAHKYCSYPEHMKEDVIEKFMKE